MKNPRWMVCRRYSPHFFMACMAPGEIRPDRAAPELMELAAHLGSMLPYRKAAELPTEFLAAEPAESHQTVRKQTLTAGARREDQSLRQQRENPRLINRKGKPAVLPSVRAFPGVFPRRISLSRIARGLSETGSTRAASRASQAVSDPNTIAMGMGPARSSPHLTAGALCKRPACREPMKPVIPLAGMLARLDLHSGAQPKARDFGVVASEAGCIVEDR